MSRHEEIETTVSYRAPLLMVQNLGHHFAQGSEDLTVFKDVHFQIERGEIVALVGPSGAGKSTLLQMVGLLDHPASGQVIIDGKTVSGKEDRIRTTLRRDHIGFVYQFHHLLPEFSALENVMIPQMIADVPAHKAWAKANGLLDLMGLSHRLMHRPARLSGGEQQRVAIARALANSPKLLLADEPTGNLDPETAQHVFDTLLKMVRTMNMGALIATHNMELARKMDRILELKSGALREG